MKQKRIFWRTTIIASGLVGVLVGLMLARVTQFIPDVFFLLVTASLLLTFRKRTWATLLITCILGLGIGLWRGGDIQQRIALYDQWYGQAVMVQGHVLDDPVYDDQGRLDFRVGQVKVDGQGVPGQIRIKGFINGLMRGDSVELNGTLGDGFGNYQASMYFATLRSRSQSTNPIEKLRREFFAAVYSVLPEPQASLGLGFLVGLRSALPEDLDGQLRVAGLTHIVVASGYNLTILVRLSRRVFAMRSKYQALVSSLGLILVFLAITGASPSMVRASVVTVLSLLAWYYGRRFQPVVIILLGATLTAGINPLFIWHDLGWWLSFLAFSGVLVLAPLVSAKVYGDKTPPLLIQVALETMSAQLMVTPLILHTFGELSLVALVANVAVVPFIPLAMATTFIAGLASLVFSGSFAGWFGLPAQLILGYIVAATQLFAKPSWAQQQVNIGLGMMVAMYAAMLLIGLWWYKKAKLSLRELPSVVE